MSYDVEETQERFEHLAALLGDEERVSSLRFRHEGYPLLISYCAYEKLGDTVTWWGAWWVRPRPGLLRATAVLVGWTTSELTPAEGTELHPVVNFDEDEDWLYTGAVARRISRHALAEAPLLYEDTWPKRQWPDREGHTTAGV